MRTLKFLSVFLIFGVISCAGDEREKPKQTPFSEFQQARKGADLVRVSGVIDLKSICLNFSPHNEVKGDLCMAYFSEHSGTNAPSQEVSLKVCHKGVSTNCIDPLPKDAPPEVIIIRDSVGNKVEPWARVDIEVRRSRGDTLTGVEVLRIDATE